MSAGNTGVLMGLATLLLRPLDGIKRPALVSAVPHIHRGHTLLLDLGANASADTTMLVQFALMGAVMAEEVLGISAPVLLYSTLVRKPVKARNMFVMLQKYCNPLNR